MRFEPLSVPLLTSYVARRILTEGARARFLEVSLDLGVSSESIETVGRKVILRDTEISMADLEEIAERPRDIYYVQDDEINPASVSTEHFYKLVPTVWGKPPTIEIDGIHMHRVKNITPDIDTKIKMRPLRGLRGKIVLDTCLGLGYTAIYALEQGARSVTSSEVDPNVYWIARLNPWSRGLTDKRVEVKLGDVVERVKEMPSKFHVIVHDPPRLSLSGSLYGREFYQSLYSVLRPGGKMIHYVGSPGMRYRHKDMMSGVKKRLGEVGFMVREIPSTKSVLAVKK